MNWRTLARIPQEVFVSIAFCGVFLALDRATLLYEISPGVTVWYPPDGLGYALLVAGGWKYAPAFVAATVFSSIVTYHLEMSYWLDILWSMGLVGVYGIAAAIVRRRMHSNSGENEGGQFLWAIGVGLAAAAFLAVTTCVAQPWNDLGAFSLAGRIFAWWCGEAIGILTITPFALIIVAPILRTLNARSAIPVKHVFSNWLVHQPRLPKPGVAMGQFALSAATIWLAVASPFAASFHLYYLCFIPVIWVAFRLELVGAAVANLLINFGTMGAIALVGSDPAEVAPIQTFMLVLVATGLVVGLMSFSVRNSEDQRKILQARVAEEGGNRERELRISGDYLNSIINACGYPIFVKDENFRFVLANDALCEMLGIAREEIIGNTLGEKLPREQMDHFLEIDRKVLESGQENECEELLIGHGGTIISIFTKKTRFVGGHGKRFLVGVIADLTERKDAEALQNNLQLQLNQAQKMEAVGRLAGGVAHDFNNLLTVINGYAEILMSDFTPGSRENIKLDAILKAGRQAETLTRQLLAFSRRQILQPHILDLNVVIGEMQSMLGRVIGEDVVLEFNPGRGLGLVLADTGQINQVMMNLAVNSRDAMAAGGRITIETANVELDDVFVAEHVGAARGAHVMIAFTDTGAGMDAKTQKHIFEPFYTTKEVGKGTGLGLSMVYGIVKQSKGSIWVESELGGGTTFRIYLPLVEGGLAGGQEQEVRRAGTRGTETVLVAEDQDSVRGLVCEVLRAKGYRVINAANGSAAAELAEHHSGPINLVLTDLVMPGTGGQELVKLLQVMRPAIKVLFMSGYTEKAMFETAMFGKGEAFIQKPFGPERLAGKVREVLDSA